MADAPISSAQTACVTLEVRVSQIAGEPGTQDFVEVRLPAAGAYLSVLRTATAGLAARLDFTLDEIEDLRIAVDEACAILLQQAVPGSVLSCGAHAPAAGGVPGPPVPQPGRAAGRPDPGRHHRPDQVGRPVRPRSAGWSSPPTPRPPSSARSSGTSGTRAGRCGCRAGSRSCKLSLTKATSELSQTRAGPRPSASWPAPRQMTEEEVLEGLESANAYSTVSLDAPDSGDGTRPPWPTRWA
jgi:hypothetical protein